MNDHVMANRMLNPPLVLCSCGQVFSGSLQTVMQEFMRHSAEGDDGTDKVPTYAK